MELAKSYTRSFVFKQGSVNIDLTNELLFEFTSVAKFVNMGLTLMMTKTMAAIQSTHYTGLVIGCVFYSLLIVDWLHSDRQLHFVVPHGKTDRQKRRLGVCVH